ncbi:MAG: TetR/AcrR family transcriptional regulator [Myxococcota bacterium]
MGEIRPGIAVHRAHIQEALQELLITKGVDAISVEELAKKAGISRATFYRCYASVDEVLMVLYDQFERRVKDRLIINLPRKQEIGDWIEDLVDHVLRDAIEMGPLLRALYREELRPSSPAAERQITRVNMQAEMISRWWEATVQIPAYEGMVEAFILLLQAAGLRVAGSQDEKELERLRGGITFLICCAVERYRTDPSSARIPELAQVKLPPVPED